MTADGEAATDLTGQHVEGNAQLNVTGLLGLLETLGEVGMLPPQQVGMFTMMATNFSTEGEGEDSRVFNLEAADGMLLVNGAPMMPLPPLE